MSSQSLLFHRDKQPFLSLFGKKNIKPKETSAPNSTAKEYAGLALIKKSQRSFWQTRLRAYWEGSPIKVAVPWRLLEDSDGKHHIGGIDLQLAG